MQATPSRPHPDAEPAAPAAAHSRGLRRLIVLFVLLVSIAVLPHWVNVSRFQKRIAHNISSALGRPVYFDNVTLVLFPQPGFTLDNVVIDEDPAFGYEPLLRADQVQVTLRLSSLWHSHTEFSKIAFSDPSVNLVYSNGRWNIESLLLQATRLEAAPTAQRFAGPARRFPYIEATGARLNLKLDQEKSPVSLTDADFALWLPEPHQWHVRLEAHPVRTDATPGDTGTLRAEGTLGGADPVSSSLDADSLAQVPIDLQGDWREAQLGGLSRLLLGRDPGLRGDFALAFAVRGTVGRNDITAKLTLAKARRADFVPDHPLSLEASCDATSSDTFRSFPTIACHWPPAGSSDRALVALTASLPDARNIASASATLTLPALPADTFFDWLSIATPHPPAVVAGAGTLTGNVTWGAPAEPPPASSLLRKHAAPAHTAQPATPGPSLTGEIQFSGGSLVLDPAANRTLPLGDVVLSSTPSPAAPSARPRRSHAVASIPAPNSFTLQPLALDLGGAQPATLTAHFDATGYTLHLTGTALAATLRQLADAVPQFGGNLPALLDRIAPATPSSAATATPESPSRAASDAPATPEASATPIPIDLTATRLWGGAQTWTGASR